MRRVLIVALAALLSGCAYNDPARFLWMMPPDQLAKIEPPLPDTCPGCPTLHRYGEGAVYGYTSPGYEGP